MESKSQSLLRLTDTPLAAALEDEVHSMNPCWILLQVRMPVSFCRTAPTDSDISTKAKLDTCCPRQAKSIQSSHSSACLDLSSDSGRQAMQLMRKDLCVHRWQQCIQEAARKMAPWLSRGTTRRHQHAGSVQSSAVHRQMQTLPVSYRPRWMQRRVGLQIGSMDTTFSHRPQDMTIDVPNASFYVIRIDRDYLT